MGNCHAINQIENIDISQLNYEKEFRYFYVISVVQNAAKSQTLIKQFLSFRKQIESQGINFITIECASGKSPFVVTKDNNEPSNIQIRSNNAFFQKENLINIALSKLPDDTKYVVFLDCDMKLMNKNWAQDTITALNQYRGVQLFEEVIFIDENDQELDRKKSLAFRLSQSKDNENCVRIVEDSLLLAGYAWGFRYEVLRYTTGLIDFSPIGNNWRIMVHSLVQNAEGYVPGDLTLVFRESVELWQRKAELWLTNRIGCVPGRIKVPIFRLKQEEKIQDKWEILQGNVFDHLNDMYKDNQGLYCLEKLKPILIKDLKEFYESVYTIEKPEKSPQKQLYSSPLK